MADFFHMKLNGESFDALKTKPGPQPDPTPHIARAGAAADRKNHAGPIHALFFFTHPLRRNPATMARVNAERLPLPVYADDGETAIALKKASA